VIFTEPRFVVFLIVCFVVHWGLRHSSARKIWLLGCSYAFYAAWDWRFLGLIVLSTAIDYIAALVVDRSGSRTSRRVALVGSIAANLAILGFFKYFHFFQDSAISLLTTLGIPAEPTTLSIILPVGISFYTFQSISYTVDVHRGKLRSTWNVLDVALFVGFFPQLVAGPIVRAAHFLPQLRRPRTLDRVDVRAALMLLLIGFVKKACIADAVAPFVDEYFANHGAYDALSAWMAVFLFALQLYCDFSGYSDMAIATARLLGYELGPNFNFPYFATSVADYWRRWHISMSSWFRDYVYIPLGGNRSGHITMLRNLALTTFLAGLWHGAAWTFALWGLLHGASLLAYHTTRRFCRIPDAAGRVLTPLFIVLTFTWGSLVRIFFRANSIEDAWLITRACVLFENLGDRRLERGLIGVFALLAVVHWVSYRGWLHRWWAPLPSWLFAFLYGCFVALAFAFMNDHAQPFIYFQF
jgi:alginate O-acetyltransferase complex protein AlgI